MRADLFKDVLVEAGRPDLCRLLFECTSTSEESPESCRDFYLYVWVYRAQQVTAFQAVMDEEFVLTFREHAPASFGTIGHQPIGRAIAESEQTAPRQRMVEILRTLQNPDFGNLFRLMGDIANKNSWSDLDLATSEKKLVLRLLKAKKKGKSWR